MKPENADKDSREAEAKDSKKQLSFRIRNDDHFMTTCT
jgi:hypothetical protein